jgi:hypothetical protein
VKQCTIDARLQPEETVIVQCNCALLLSYVLSQARAHTYETTLHYIMCYAPSSEVLHSHCCMMFCLLTLRMHLMVSGWLRDHGRSQQHHIYTSVCIRVGMHVLLFEDAANMRFELLMLHSYTANSTSIVVVWCHQ